MNNIFRSIDKCPQLDFSERLGVLVIHDGSGFKFQSETGDIVAQRVVISNNLFPDLDIPELIRTMYQQNDSP